MTRNDEKDKRRTKGAHFQDGRSKSPGFTITGERAGFLHYPSVMVDAFRSASATTQAETRSDREDETRTERAEKAAMVAEARATKGATTTVAQHSGGPCSSSSWSLGRTV